MSSLHNIKLGQLGEKIAADFLVKNGYKIVDRNRHISKNEIDIIAEDSSFLVFVEVKTRSEEAHSPKEERPASAVTPEKQRKILHSASIYKAFHPQNKKMRFDIVEVLMRGGRVKKINHLIAAFDAGTAYPSHRSRV